MLPAMGVTSDILSTFSRKPIFGYHAMAFSMIAIAFLSWIVWGHHMFVSGMNPLLGTAFMMTTMVIAVPSAIKVFNWLRHLVGRHDSLDVADAFALGFVSNFVIGGSERNLHGLDAGRYLHPRHVLHRCSFPLCGRRNRLCSVRGGLLLVSPRCSARTMNEPLAKIHFILTYIFFNGAFFPCTSSASRGTCGEFTIQLNTSSCSRCSIGTCSSRSARCSWARRSFFLFNFVWSLIAGKKRIAIPGRPTRWNGRRRRRRRTAISRYNRLSTAAPTSTARRKSKRIGCRKIEISVLPPQRERINGKLEI